MGVRLAIGASPRSLVRLVVRQAFVPAVLGLAAGLIATRGAARLAEAQSFQVDTHDPAMLVLAGATVMLTAFVAAWLPARRASRIDPVAVLRAE
jgi:ABC-type antimicrobial peptide transport system permease subunit